MPVSENQALETISGFLSLLRNAIAESSLNLARLPGWINAARVRMGIVNNHTLVAVFDDAILGDEYTSRGLVGADTVVLLDIEDFIGKGGLDLNDAEGLTIIQGEYGHHTSGSIVPLGTHQAMLDCGHPAHHAIYGLFNLSFRTSTLLNGKTHVRERFVPFALYVHEKDAQDPINIWRLSQATLIDFLVKLHNSDLGSFYEQQKRGT